MGHLGSFISAEPRLGLVTYHRYPLRACVYRPRQPRLSRRSPACSPTARPADWRAALTHFAARRPRPPPSVPPVRAQLRFVPGHGRRQRHLRLRPVGARHAVQPGAARASTGSISTCCPALTTSCSAPPRPRADSGRRSCTPSTTACSCSPRPSRSAPGAQGRLAGRPGQGVGHPGQRRHRARHGDQQGHRERPARSCLGARPGAAGLAGDAGGAECRLDLGRHARRPELRR